MVNYKFIGWCKDGTADKVWVCIKLNGDRWGGAYATVWGRRGKKLQHKVFPDGNDWELNKLIDKKWEKGYKPVNKNDLDEVYPEFENDLEATALWAMLQA
jgi:predicted DNA-binding WGR domain protein